MSLKATQWAWQYAHKDTAARLVVVLALADFADDRGEAFPRIATLATKVGRSRGAVKHILRELEQPCPRCGSADVLTLQGKGRGPSPDRRSSLYVLPLDRTNACERGSRAVDRQTPRRPGGEPPRRPGGEPPEGQSLDVATAGRLTAEQSPNNQGNGHENPRRGRPFLHTLDEMMA